MELKIGKWYKYYYRGNKDGRDTWYFKYSHSEESRIMTSVYISSRDKKYKSCNLVCMLKINDIKNVFELCDLSEIIPFLPKNHPDINIVHEIW